MAYVEHGRGSSGGVGAAAHYVSISGRADQREFLVCSVAAGALAAAAMAAHAANLVPWAAAAVGAGAAFVGITAATVRRLHDVGVSGLMVWSQLAMLVAIFGVGSAIFGKSVGLLLGEGLIGALALGVVALGWAIARCVRTPGDAAENRYGAARR